MHGVHGLVEPLPLNKARALQTFQFSTRPLPGLPNRVRDLIQAHSGRPAKHAEQMLLRWILELMCLQSDFFFDIDARKQCAAARHEFLNQVCIQQDSFMVFECSPANTEVGLDAAFAHGRVEIEQVKDALANRVFNDHNARMIPRASTE